MLAAHEACLCEARCDMRDQGRQMRPVIALPDAVFLLAQRSVVRPAGGMLQQELGKGSGHVPSPEPFLWIACLKAHVVVETECRSSFDVILSL
ncbi:hypothetical protein D3C72_2292760 [compost metagenome]